MAATVIGISGPPGAGKTTLVAALARRLGRVAVLEFDRYELATFQEPAAIIAWLDAGADHDALPTGRMGEDLARLKRGEAVIGGNGPDIAPAPLVLFDTLLGRSHGATGPLIDRLIWLDTPLDVALARKVGGLLAMAEAGGAAEAREMVGWLGAYLGQYLAFIRRTYVIQRERVRPGADLILDGMDDPDAAADRVVRALPPGLL